MSINKAGSEAKLIIDEFNFFDDWEDRYQMLIDIGRKLPAMPQKYMSDQFRLRGCQSVVYFASETDKDGNIHFFAQSDAAIVQGLIGLLLRVYSGCSPDEIRDTDPGFLKLIGLDSHLSATRKNGLANMLEAIKSAAKNR
tara:strand:+ start:90 stop:509 length:420 start_codon:yes stop_codon:yes gene_type:complete